MTANHDLYTLFAPRFDLPRDVPALVDAAGTGPTIGELADLSARFARVLQDRGAEPGDRVVVKVEKSVGAVLVYLACLRLGAINDPLNTSYSAAEVDYFLGDAEPKLLVSGALLGTDPASPLWAEAEASKPFDSVAEWGAYDIAAILYTSGTIGQDGSVRNGTGCFESIIIGRHAPSGFTSLYDLP